MWWQLQLNNSLLKFPANKLFLFACLTIKKKTEKKQREGIFTSSTKVATAVKSIVLLTEHKYFTTFNVLHNHILLRFLLHT